MAAILSEGGQNARIMLRFMSEKEQAENESFGGHTWLEINSAERAPYVFDPSTGVVRTLAESAKNLKEDHKRNDALWFSHPERKFLPRH